MTKKDHIKDYATAAFRFYKSVGGLESYKNKIWQEALLDRRRDHTGSAGVSKPTEADIIRAEKAIDSKFSEIADLEAVEETLEILGRMEIGRFIIEAVEIVYWTDLHIPINQQGLIQERVHKASLHIPASERTVYRYLFKARTIFAFERGLRLDCEQFL